MATNTRDDFDVLVAGGGIAGVAAAVAAARLDARALLVERYGFLGGLATAGLVNPFMSHYTSDRTPLIAGFFDELRDRLTSLGGLMQGSFDPEAMKFALQELAIESGVTLLLHSLVTGVELRDGGVSGAKITNKSGERLYCAKRFIDATGDGDLAAAAGAAFETGGKDGLPQAMTLMLDVAGVDLTRAMTYVRENPDQMRFPKLPPETDIEQTLQSTIAVAGYYDLVTRARENGDYPLPGDLIFYISRPTPGEVVFNTTHVGEVDGTSAEDLTHAEIEGRRQAMALVGFVKKYVPGFENASLARTATQIGVRETRRVTGEYVFSARDVIDARKFPDAIARLAYPVDVHAGKGDGYTREEEHSGPVVPPPGDWYEVPYRCLVPLMVENLLTAGRCVSSTQEGHGAIRIMPCCAAMGQAAGAAAALSIKAGVTPRRLEIDTLARSLRDQGALV